MNRPSLIRQLMKPLQSRKIYLIRHAQTAANKAGQADGRSQSFLTSEGKTQALALRAYLLRAHPDVYDPTRTAIVTSGAHRTEETADIVFPSLPRSTDPGFLEVDLGDAQGKTWLQTEAEHLIATGHSAEDYFPGGESFFSAQQRSKAALDQLLNGDMRDPVIIGHGGVISLLILALMDVGISAFPFTHIDNASVSIVELNLIDNLMYPIISTINLAPWKQ